MNSEPEPMKQPPEFQLTFRAIPNHPWTGEQRLKRLLKIAGRALGLRCVSCKETNPTERQRQ